MKYIKPVSFRFYFEDKAKLAILESTAFIKWVEEYYSVDQWIDAWGENTVSINEVSIRNYIFKTAKSQGEPILDDHKQIIESLCAVWSLGSSLDYAQRIGVTVSVGSKSHFLPDSICLELATGIPFPSQEFVRDTIVKLDAVRFCIEDYQFKDVLKSIGIVYPKLPQQISRRPLHLFWQNYFNTEIIDLLGGMEHCLQTPAYSVESFHKGLFIQITEEPFQPGNEEQLHALLAAMKHLKIPQ
ncbi:MAG: hypothetical protein JKY95_15520 [Planctomycetaceae bacterium]|nr:hypothetical protein [Planctomycetaceae bacterium]